MAGLGLQTNMRLLQRQQLSLEMQLGFRLLQMSRHELENYIEEQVTENPYLDWVHTEPAPNRIRLGVDFAVSTEQTSDWIDSVEQPEGSEYEKLFEQIDCSGWPDSIKSELHGLVPYLNQHGFLPEISPFEGQTEEEYDDAVRQFQRLDPPGVGARNVKESLLLQAAAADLPELVDQLVLRYMDLIASGEFEKICRQAKCTDDELRGALSDLRTLSPYPMNLDHMGPTRYSSPDVVVECRNGVYEVVGTVSTRLAPSFSQNLKGVVGDATLDADEKKLMQQKKRDAQALLKFCDLREDTILQVAKIVVRQQQQFFQIGAKGLQPLTLKDVADEMGVHESTVSRATNGKTMLSDRGLLPFRNFFAQRVSDEENGNDAVSAAVRAELKALLDEESQSRPDKPYSDEEIAAELADRGMAVARRTVSKYRKMLDIPSKGERKRQYKLSSYVREG